MTGPRTSFHCATTDLGPAIGGSEETARKLAAAQGSAALLRALLLYFRKRTAERYFAKHPARSAGEDRA